MENNQEKNIRNKKYRNIDELSELKKWLVNLGAEISEETKSSYENLMYKVATFEQNYMGNRDLYTFSKKEILNMFESFGSSSVATLNVYTSIIRKYCDLAIENGYLKNNINQANNIRVEDLVELVNKFKVDKKIVTRDYFYNLVEEKLVNYQEQAMLLLCFEGIKGNNYSELSNLKTEDIDFDKGTVKVNRNGEEILITVSKRLSNILFRTRQEDEYKMHNGIVKINENKKTTGGRYRDLLSLEETPYFLRPMKNRSQEANLTGNLIQARMIRCCTNYLDLPFMTPSSIYLSGVIHRLMEYAKEIGEDILSHKQVAECLNSRKENLNTYSTFLAYKEIIGEE